MEAAPADTKVPHQWVRFSSGGVRSSKREEEGVDFAGGIWQTQRNSRPRARRSRASRRSAVVTNQNNLKGCAGSRQSERSSRGQPKEPPVQQRAWFDLWSTESPDDEFDVDRRLVHRYFSPDREPCLCAGGSPPVLRGARRPVVRGPRKSRPEAPPLRPTGPPKRVRVTPASYTESMSDGGGPKCPR